MKRNIENHYRIENRNWDKIGRNVVLARQKERYLGIDKKIGLL